ncbi:HIT family protein [Rugosibacter aromaticivorans]|nr:HIT family protein [Rugosibacter aromaticivorans]
MHALPMMSEYDCELCHSPGGEELWADSHCRVVRVTSHEGTTFPGFCRVIWQPHVAEMSDLTEREASHLMRIVQAVERTLRQQLAPDKINLASLGNLVPHLHWHVIPRWHDDSHFPSPIWATPSRIGAPRIIPSSTALSTALHQQLLPRSHDQ